MLGDKMRQALVQNAHRISLIPPLSLSFQYDAVLVPGTVEYAYAYTYTLDKTNNENDKAAAYDEQVERSKLELP
jgi:hypothetical protein